MENQFNPFTLKGKTILITGASSGIGRQCAIDCSKMGAKVVLIGRNKERLEQTVAQMDNGEHLSVCFDLNDIEGIKLMMTEVVSSAGKLDGFIHAAGIEITAPLKLSKSTDYESLYRTNCLSAFEIVKQLDSVRTFNDGGSILLIASITGVIARNGLSAYAASKGALISAARVMASELSRRRIRVNTISPGTILTPMMQTALDEMTEEKRNKRVEGFPLGLGKPEDISNACIYLLSDAARWMTGQNLIVDGGYTCR